MHSFSHSYFSKHLLSFYKLIIVIMIVFTEHILSLESLGNAKLLPSGREQTIAHHVILRSSLLPTIMGIYPTHLTQPVCL